MIMSNDDIRRAGSVQRLSSDNGHRYLSISRQADGMAVNMEELTALVHDAPILFKVIRDELDAGGRRDDVWLMGRSLGSISALELAHRHPDRIKGLVIESGFPSVVRLISHLNIPAGDAPLESIYEDCMAIVRAIKVPTLIIHGEYDTLVPIKEAEDLYNNLGATDKELVTIGAAEHNDIMFVGLTQYFEAIVKFIERTD